MKPFFRRNLFSSLFFLVSVSAYACVTNSQNRLEEDVQSWVGMRQDDVETYWGEADEVLEIGEGQRVLQYAAEHDNHSPYPCVVIFSINKYGFVLGSKFNGDVKSCRNFVKVIPEEQRNIAKQNNLVILEAIDNLQQKAQ